MNRPDDPRKNAPASVSAGFVWTLLLIFLALFLLASLGTREGQVIFLIAKDGVFGWIGFVMRVVPEIRWNPMAIATALLCLAFLLVGAHRFLAWLSRAWQTGQDGAVPWRMRWTVSALSLTLLAFVAGTAIVGAVHQIAWLASSPDPWVRNRHSLDVLLALMQYRKETDLARSDGKPLTVDTLRALRKDVDENIRVVVLDDKEGLPWFVAVGPRESGNYTARRCFFWSYGEHGKKDIEGHFTVDQWQEVIADADAGRSLARFAPR